MNLKNGYKVMYEVIEGSNRVFKASKTGLFADADTIETYPIGSFKVVYQRGNEFFGIDAEGAETKLEALDAIFAEAATEEVEQTEPASVETEIPTPVETEEVIDELPEDEEV